MKIDSKGEFVGYISELLPRLTTVQDIWDESCLLFSRLGFDAIYYANVSSSCVQILTNFPEKLPTGNPQSEAQIRTDPLFRHCFRSLDIISTGSDYVDDHPELTSDEKSFIRHAGSTGFTAGFASPCQALGPKGFAGWNLLSNRGREFVEQFRASHEVHTRLVNYMIHVALQNAYDAKTEDIPISKRELQCLKLLSVGIKNKQISDILNISTATVEFHLKNIRRKLNASTREHAISIAFDLGIIP